jgi:hypothetical protein
MSNSLFDIISLTRKDYFATFSRRLRIEKMKIADTRQIAISVPQIIERSIPHILPGIEIR